MDFRGDVFHASQKFPKIESVSARARVVYLDTLELQAAGLGELFMADSPKAEPPWLNAQGIAIPWQIQILPGWQDKTILVGGNSTPT